MHCVGADGYWTLLLKINQNKREQLVANKTRRKDRDVLKPSRLSKVHDSVMIFCDKATKSKVKCCGGPVYPY